jgi:type IV pilus assembly protein PilM
MAKKITTLFIRDEGIYVAVLNGQKIEKWASSPLEAGLVVQGLITDEAKVAASVRDLMKNEQIRGGKTVVGVSGANSLYRMITLPEMPDALLAEAVRREAKRVLPVSLDEVYLSHQEVPSVSKGEKRLFLVTYPKNTTDAVIKTSRLAGIDPYLMDLAPLALARIPDEPRAIIVNARGSHADIIVLEDKLPQLIRVLSLSAEAGTLQEKLPGVTEELARTVIFYNSSHAEKPLNQTVPLFVCGELCEFPETWPQLVGRLNFPVSALHSSIEIPEGMPGSDFMVNIGLGLKEFAVERSATNASIINLNILPEVFHPKKVPVSSVLLPVIAVVGVGLLAYMATFVIRATNDTKVLRQQVASGAPAIAAQQQKIVSLKSDLDKLTPQIAPLDAQITQLNSTASIFTSTMSSLETNRTKLYSDMNERVIGKLPFNKHNLTLLNVTVDTGTFSINGIAQNEDYIFDYTRKLRESGGISEVLITSIQYNKDANNYTFDLVIK